MLTDMEIRKAKPRDRGYKLTDARGLHVFVSPTGAKSLRLKYSFGGKEKVLTFGQWPDVSLARARELATVARATLAEGRDPGTVKRQDRAAAIRAAGMTLEAIATEFHTKQSARWAEKQRNSFLSSLRRDIFPALGALPITEIDPPLVLHELNRVERRGSIEAAHRLRQRLDQIFVYAVATGRATTNPAAQLRGALTALVRTNKQPAITTEEGVRALYRAIGAYPAEAETRACALFQALTAVRPSDAREAEWAEIEGLDGETPIWRVPAARLKGTKKQKADASRAHLVPLSPQAVAVLREIQPLTGWKGDLIFPSVRFPNRPMSDMTLSMLYQRAGFKDRHVPHGWRASFSTIMNERHPAERDAIDAALAHVRQGVEGRYNRAEHLARRRDLFAEWGTLLTDQEAGTDRDAHQDRPAMHAVG